MPTPPRRSAYSAVAPQALGRPDGSIATTTPLSTSPGAIERQSDYYTLITLVNPQPNGQPQILYNGDRLWAKVTLTLETAGIVVVGNRADIVPITSGKGIELVTNEIREFTVAKGTRLYYAASAVNRVVVQVEPLPWLEQITASAEATLGSFRTLFQKLTR